MSSLSVRTILDKLTLTGPNFLDWIRNVRLVLRQEKIEYVLDSAAPVRPTEQKELEEFDKDNAKVKHLDDAYNAQCIMLASMTMELQRQHEHLMAFEMLSHLKGLFENVKPEKH